MKQSVPMPVAPISPIVKRTAMAWPAPTLAYKPPSDLAAYVRPERPHERQPASKGARNLIEVR